MQRPAASSARWDDPSECMMKNSYAMIDMQLKWKRG